MTASRYHPDERVNNLTVLAFANLTQAFQLRDALLALEGERLFHLAEAAVVTREPDGRVQLHQPVIDNAAGCAAIGSLTGLIVGTVFMLPGLGVAVGSGIGAIIGALSDLGVDDQFMKKMGAMLTPGTSALVLLGDKAELDALGQRLGVLLRGSTLLSTTVNPEREAEIRKLLQN